MSICLTDHILCIIIQFYNKNDFFSTFIGDRIRTKQGQLTNLGKPV